MKYPRLPEKLNKSLKIGSEEIRKIKKLLKEGWLKKDIAKKLQVSYSTIWLALLSPKERKIIFQRQYQKVKKKGINKEDRRKRQLKSYYRKTELVPELREYANEKSRIYRKRNNR